MKNEDFENIVSQKLVGYTRQLNAPQQTFDHIHQKLNHSKGKGNNLFKNRLFMLLLLSPVLIGITYMLLWRVNKYLVIENKAISFMGVPPAGYFPGYLETGSISFNPLIFSTTKNDTDTYNSHTPILAGKNKILLQDHVNINPDEVTYMNKSAEKHSSFYYTSYDRTNNFSSLQKYKSKKKRIPTLKTNDQSLNSVNHKSTTLANHTKNKSRKKGIITLKKDDQSLDSVDMDNNFTNKNNLTSRNKEVTTLKTNDQSLDSIQLDSAHLSHSKENIYMVSQVKNFYQPVHYSPSLSLLPFTVPEKEKKVRFSIFAHVSMIGTKNIIAPGLFANYSSIDSVYLTKRKEEDQFQFGLQTGMGTRIRIKKYFSITLGLDYSYYNYNQTINNSGPFVSNTPPSKYYKKTESLEVPVTAGVCIPFGKAEINIDLGLASSIVFFATYFDKPPGSNVIKGYEGWLGNGTPHINTFNLHLIGNVFFNYALNTRWKIFAGFTSRYAFLSLFNSSYPQTISQNPYGLGGKIGVEYRLGKKEETK